MSRNGERRQGSRDSVKSKLGWLSRLGAPVVVSEFNPEYDYDYGLRLRTDTEAFTEIELADNDDLPWYDMWQIIGCFVSQAAERGELALRDELLEAAKVGLDEVLQVRIRQIVRDGLRA